VVLVALGGLGVLASGRASTESAIATLATMQKQWSLSSLSSPTQPVCRHERTGCLRETNES
jgi:hypothetical protein